MAEVSVSRYMLKDVSSFEGFQHGAVGASITTKGGLVIRFYSIHLDYLHAVLRMKGFLCVHKDAEKFKNVIITGDFNAFTQDEGWPADKFSGKDTVMKKAKAFGYCDTFLHIHGKNFAKLKEKGLVHTNPSAAYENRIRPETNKKETLRRIDYILVSQSLVKDIKAAKILKESQSDHYPLLCEIGLSG